MPEERAEAGQTGKICLFNFGREILEEISEDEKIFHLLKESGNIKFLDEVNMFLDLNDEDSLWVADECDKEEEEWTFELPAAVVDAIRKVAEEISEQKSLEGSGGL